MSTDLMDAIADQNAAETCAEVYLVDDHQVELDLLQRWCQRAGFSVRTYDDPRVFLSELADDAAGCVVADLRMPVVSGLELQAELQKRNCLMPVILVTGYGDAVNCRAAFHQGVFDFVEKGFDSSVLVDLVGRAIRKNRKDRFQAKIREQARESLSVLSPREHEVSQLLASGASLKIVAQELDISVQTASKHRGNIFSKLSLDNEVDLYKLLLVAQCALEA